MTRWSPQSQADQTRSGGAQTAEAWRLVGHRAPMAAVCSLEKDEVLERLGVRTTTNPIQLALWAGHGPVVVLQRHGRVPVVADWIEEYRTTVATGGGRA